MRSLGSQATGVSETLGNRPLHLSKSLNDIAILAAVLIMITSSFDIFLVIRTGGTFRFGQLIEPILVMLALLRAMGGTITPTLGLAPLIAWFIVQLSFAGVTEFLPKSIGYCLWLLLNIALMYSFVQLFSDNMRTLTTVLRWYLYSFGIIAAFAPIQFILPLLNLPAPLVTEWWIHDRVPRLNGFSYEPSYYAAYLLIGFVLIGALQRSGSTLLTGKALRRLRWLTGGAIILSSSRLGITFLVLDVLSSQVMKYFYLIRDPARALFEPIRWRGIAATIVGLCMVSVGIYAAGTFVEEKPAVVALLLAGTGIDDTTEHSVVERERSLVDTLTVFSQHPFVGYSLGGVSYAIGKLHGYTVASFEQSKPFEGMSVFAEALASSGIVGIVPFVAFLAVTIYKPIKLAKISTPFYAQLLRALVRSLAFEWAILQFNQNILRPYLWVHLSVLALVYASAWKSLAGGSNGAGASVRGGGAV